MKIRMTLFVLLISNYLNAQVNSRTCNDANILVPNSSQLGFLNAQRTSSYFREAYLENIPLSTTSFFSNQRFYTTGFEKRFPCILDAITNFYIPIIGNWGFTRPKKDVPEPKVWLFGLYLIPAFDIRIYQDDATVGDASSPVRTPSLKAGGEFIFTHSMFWNYYNAFHKRHKAAIFVKGYHHSNGQDGVSILSKDMPYAQRGYINTYNGNFSDDFPLQLGAIYLHQRQNHSFFFKAGYEFSQYLNFGIDKLTDWYNLYSTERVMLSGNYKYMPCMDWSTKNMPPNGVYLTNYNIEYLRIEWYLTYFVTSPKKWNYGPVDLNAMAQHDLKQVDWRNSRRINAAITSHYKIPGTRSTGIFCQIGYHGQDTYNVYFQWPNFFLRFGVSYGQFTYPKKTDDLGQNAYRY